MKGGGGRKQKEGARGVGRGRMRDVRVDSARRPCLVLKPVLNWANVSSRT